MRVNPEQETAYERNGLRCSVAGNASLLPELGQAVLYYHLGPTDRTGIFVHSYKVGWRRFVAVAALSPVKYSLYNHGKLTLGGPIKSQEIALHGGESIMIASPGVGKVVTPDQIAQSLKGTVLNPAQHLLDLARLKAQLDPSKEAVLTISRAPTFLSRFFRLT